VALIEPHFIMPWLLRHSRRSDRPRQRRTRLHRPGM